MQTNNNQRSRSRLGKSPWSWVPSLYFAEGLPYVMVTIVAAIFYKQMNLSNEDIAYYTAWLNFPWVVKPLWSPFIDIFKTKRWWVLSMQVLIGAALGGVAFTIPTSFWLQGTLFFFWVMAFSSATHDIAADGFYMLGLNHHQQALFVGIRSTCYKFAVIFGKSVLVIIAGNLQVLFRGGIKYSWCLVFYGVAGLYIALWLWHGYILSRPKSDVTNTNMTAGEVANNLKVTIKTFFTKYPPKETLKAFLFMLFYRMPEGLLYTVSTLFILDSASKGGLGLSPQELGFVQGLVGTIGLILGGIIGGMCISRDGLKHWLWPMVFAISLPSVVYVYLSYFVTSSFLVINICMFVEQFGYGFGFSAYMMYLIYYCQDKYKVSHYAFCTGIMRLSMMLPGLVAGWLQEQVGYRWFFIIVVAFCSLTFIVSAYIKIDPSFGKKEAAEDEIEAED